MDVIIVKKNEKESIVVKKAIYYILGLLEVDLAFRLVFKLLGANPASDFVSFVYTTTQIFLAPFTAIFRSAETQGIETTAVLEPSTIIAMIVYALIAWGIVKVIIAVRERGESKA